MRHLRVEVTLSIILLIMTVFAVGAVSAEKSITIDVPENAVSINQVTSIPVTIHGAEKIIGFLIQVPNNIPGVTITARDPNLSDRAGGMYTLNSASDNDYQTATWFVATGGITGDEVLLYIDVLPTKKSASMIPITIEVMDEMFDDDLVEVHSQYPVVSGQLTIIGATGTNPAAQSADSQKTEGVTPTQTETVKPTESVTPTNSAVPTESVTPAPSTTQATEVSNDHLADYQNQTADMTKIDDMAPTYSSPSPVSPTPTQSPSPLLGAFVALGVLAILSIRKGKF